MTKTDAPDANGSISSPEKLPFVVNIQYKPKGCPSLLLSCQQKRSSTSIDLKRNSTLSNYVLDDCLQKHIHAALAKSLDMETILPLPDDAKGADRHDVGRIRREISRLRRTLQSHPGQRIGEEEDDDDYDPEEEGPRPFNEKVNLEIDLPAPRSIEFQSTITTEEYGDICTDVFQKAVWDPILAMMKDAECENPFQVGMTVVVQMSGLRVPGLREYLEKQLHQMKVGGADATAIASVEDQMPRELTVADLTLKEVNSRVHAILEPGANVDDEAALDEKMFALVVDHSESWPLYQEMAMCGMFQPQMSLGGMMNALDQSYEWDYYSDMEFSSDEDEDDDDQDEGENEDNE